MFINNEKLLLPLKINSMKKIRNHVKLVSNFFGISIYLFKIYFYLLSFQYNCKVKFNNSYVKISKKNRHIKIRRGKKDLGVIGLVLRDFESFYDTVIPDNNIIDFTIPKYHKIKTGHNFYFHDICEPLAVTNIYINKAQLKGDGEVVIDIGCYCGTQTVFYSELVGENGLVIGFEPDDDNFNSLSKNIKESKFKSNIIIKKIGIYNFDGEISFNGNGSMGSKIETHSTTALKSIKVKKLDSIAEEFKLERCDFIKMDIEGSEIEVLISSKKFIKKYSPKFIIEPNFINGKLNTNMIISIFNSLNYTTEILKQGDFDYQPLIFAFPNV